MKKNNKPKRSKKVPKKLFFDGFLKVGFETIKDYLIFKFKREFSKASKLFRSIEKPLLDNKAKEIIIDTNKIELDYLDERFIRIIINAKKFNGITFKEVEKARKTKTFPKTFGRGGTLEGLTYTKLRLVEKKKVSK